MKDGDNIRTIPFVSKLGDSGLNLNLSKKLNWLTFWFGKNLEKEELVDWVLDKGSGLNISLRQWIKRTLEDNKIQSNLNEIWNLLIYSNSSDSINNSEFYYYKNIEMLKDHIWSNSEKNLFIFLSTPTVSLSKQYRFGKEERKSICDFIQVEINLPLEQNDPLFMNLREDPFFKENCALILFELISNLKKAMDYFILYEDTRVYYTITQLNSLNNPSRNNSFREVWTYLVDFIQIGMEYWYKNKKDTFFMYLETLKNIDFQIFRRLVLWSFSLTDGYKLKESIKYLIDLEEKIWTDQLENEIYSLFIKLCKTFNSKELSSLLQLVKKCPLKTSLDDCLYYKKPFYYIISKNMNSIPSYIKNDILNLEKHGYKLPENDEEIYSNSGIVHPLFGKKSDYTYEQFQMMADQVVQEVADILMNHKENRERLMEQWEKFVGKNKGKAAEIFTIIAKDVKFDPLILEYYLRSFNNEWTFLEFKETISKIDINEKYNLHNALIYSLTNVFYTVTNDFDISDLSDFFIIWDNIFQLSNDYVINQKYKSFHGPITTAINNPIGKLSETLFQVYFKTSPKTGQGIDISFKERFGKLLKLRSKVKLFAIPIFGQFLYSLFQIDPNWTKKYIIPLFSWNNKNYSLFAWTGFFHGRH